MRAFPVALFLAQARGIRNAYFNLAPLPQARQGARMILIAFGANLPGPDQVPPRETCKQAIAAIGEIEGLKITAVSPLYLSAPVPVSDQPPYINGVLRAEGAIEPAMLLARLLAIEGRFGRRRTGLNAARSLDLDVIAMDGLVRAAPDPILPHPRAHERAFVLRPLADVAPDWRHPILGSTAAEILTGLPQQAIERIGDTGAAEGC